MVKEMVVYYGSDLLPYKDKELQVHYPIVGGAFQGASQANKIKFYVDKIGDFDTPIWLAVSKLPNGQVGYTKVEENSDEDGTYVTLTLTRWHTQYKGNLFVNLQCYDGGVEFEEDPDTGYMYPVGEPVVQVTGSVNVYIAYATGIVDGGDIDIHTLQELLSYFAYYLRKDSDKFLKIVSAKEDINNDEYEDYLRDGDIIYSLEDLTFYEISGEHPTLTYSEIHFHFNWTIVDYLFVGENMHVYSFDDIYDNTQTSIATYIANQISGASDTYVTLATEQTISGHKTFSTTITANAGINFGNGANVNMYNGYILNNRTKLFGIGTSSNNRTFYQFPYGSITDNTHGESNPYTLATEDYVDNAIESLGSVFNYRGSFTVSYINTNLTAEVLTTGDVVNVEDSGTLTLGNVQVIAGDNVVWNGTSWDKLAGTIDLSGYATKIYVDSALGNYYTSSQIDTMLASYVLSTSLLASDNDILDIMGD